MFYKHWKKIALALTGLFWASCDSDSTSANEASQSPDESSASKADGTSSGSAVKENSSSSAIQYAQALYGVPSEVVSCYLNRMDSSVVCAGRTACKMLSEERWESEYKCIEDICPDYGVVHVGETTYECDGKVYNEAEFKAKYNIVYEYDPSKEPVICDETDENTVTCRDGVTYTITTDEKGHKTYTDPEGEELSEEEFEEKYVIQHEEYAPLYGISW